MNYNPDSISETLGALLIFSDEFAQIMLNVGLGVAYYKTVVMLTKAKEKTANEKDISRINEHIAFYREKLFIIVSLIKDSFFELDEEDDAFNIDIIRKSSKTVGEICDDLLEYHGYGDVADLSKDSNGVDLSDFYILDDEEDDDEEEFEEEDNETDY